MVWLCAISECPLSLFLIDHILRLSVSHFNGLRPAMVCHPSPQKRPLYPPSGFYGHTYANSRGQYNPHKHARGNLRGSYTSMYRYRISARLFEMIRPRVKLHLSIVTMTPHLVTSFSFPSCQLSPSLPHIIYRFQFPTEIERLRISRFFDTWTVDFKGI